MEYAGQRPTAAGDFEHGQNREAAQAALEERRQSTIEVGLALDAIRGRQGEARDVQQGADLVLRLAQ